MLTRLTLTDFMAHGRTVLDLGPGLTVLVGLNNTGKSAVVEALRCLATNPAPKHFIRHGAKQATVEAEFDDGIRVVWIRKKASAGYEIHRPGAEPEKFWKLGKGGVPEDVQRVLRLNLVELDDSRRGSIDVHLGNQREPVFLLNESPSTMASFFAASTESVHLLNMQQALKTRVSDAKKAVRQATLDMDAAGAQLDALAALPELELRLEALREERVRLAGAQTALPRLASMANTIAQSRADRSGLKRRLQKLATAETPPTLHPAKTLAAGLHSLQRLTIRQRETRVRQQALAQLAEPPKLSPVKPLAALLATKQQLEAQRRKAETRATALKDLQSAPHTIPTAPLADLTHCLTTARDRLAALQSRAAAFGGLPAPPALEGTAGLSQAANQLSALRSRAAQAEKSAAGARDRLATFEAELEAKLRTIGHCPTCRAELSAEAFLEHSHD